MAQKKSKDIPAAYREKLSAIAKEIANTNFAELDTDKDGAIYCISINHPTKSGRRVIVEFNFLPQINIDFIQKPQL